MEAVRQYILSVVCMVMICGVAQVLFSVGSAGTILKIICGLLVTITVLRPVIKDRMFAWDENFSLMSENGEMAVSEGQLAAEKSLAQLITDKTRTYILNKASQMGADIAVEVVLNSEYPFEPVHVTIKGTVSPYVRKQLAQCISNELSIAEDDQIWIS